MAVSSDGCSWPVRSTAAPVQGTSHGAASEQLAGAFRCWGYFDGGASEIHTVKGGSTEAASSCQSLSSATQNFIYAAVEVHFNRLVINRVGLVREFLF